jgi:DNA repair protein RadC
MIVSTARDAADLFRPLFADLAGEAVAMAYLDREQKLLEVRLLSQGSSIDEVTLPLREILSEALRLGADGLIIAHNHPSGDPTPSRTDLDATRELAATARNLGIRLVDHLILGGGEVTSLRGLGLM